MSDISKVKLPDGSEFNIKDAAVPSWAKAASKPTYTYTEVGAMSAETIIPAAQTNSDWTATTGVASILNKPAISASLASTGVAENLIGDPYYSAIYSIYVTGDGTNFTYTTEDTLPSASTITNQGIIVDGNIINKILSIDTSAKTIIIDYSSPSSKTNYEVQLYILQSNIAKTYGHAEGYKTIANGTYSHAEGNYTQAKNMSSHAEGGSTRAKGYYSHAEGSNTVAEEDSSHAEGYYTQANGHHSHAEGNHTQANGDNSHAEGSYTATNSSYSHAEGFHTQVDGTGGHAEGFYAQANGNYSHAEGYYTVASHRSQHVFGAYNITDSSSVASSQKGTYVEIVGNGTAEDSRSNARTLDWSGNEILTGKLTLGVAGSNSMDAATVGQIPSVPSWALESSKPTYTYAEVGAASAEHTHNFYWANVATATTSTYNTTPEVAILKLNGNTSAATASTSNVQLIFDPSTQVLNFVFT